MTYLEELLKCKFAIRDESICVCKNVCVLTGYSANLSFSFQVLQFSILFFRCSFP